EFLEKGYMGATIRGIGKRAGMTSAGLYRHYQNKEAMFAGVVEPLVNEICEWMERHRSKGFQMIESYNDQDMFSGGNTGGNTDGNTGGHMLFNESFTDMIVEVVLPKKDEFKLLYDCSKGSKFENFIPDFIAENQNAFFKAYSTLKEKGFPVKDIDEAEIRMLISANVSACFLPIIQDYDDEKIEGYMSTLNEFFMPGWKGIFGVD
ncbi:MAG: TetR/AcrR family transcriptional regulator, partial [Lachnospiraceae bacterium]|nr:TetR/AcrR family transcriptional regulator [Lachnospiraceae bacterium]